MGIFFKAFLEADPFGKMIFLTLFSLSGISSFFFIYKIWALKKVKIEAQLFLRSLKKQKNFILNLEVAKLYRPLGYTLPHPFRGLYVLLKEKAIEILDKNRFFTSKEKTYLSRTDIELLESHLHLQMTKEKERLEKHLFILPTTVTLAPFLGLLGTVWGILITFGQLQAGHSLLSNGAILGGLSTALTTTVFGLLIAIPALIAYNYLKNLSRHFEIEMQDFSHFLLSTVELQYRQVDLEK